MGSLLVDPVDGNVGFGSGFNQWGFTLGQFANKFKGALNMTKEETMKILWGDNFYNKKKKKLTTKTHSKKGKPYKRLFVHFIMDPIIKMHKLCMEGQVEPLKKMLKNVNVELTNKEWKLEGRHICKTVMAKWLNASEAILEMVVLYIPSPK